MRISEESRVQHPQPAEGTPVPVRKVLAAVYTQIAIVLLL
jgi:hypothetical protein